MTEPLETGATSPDKLNSIPARPGIYVFVEGKRVIYVGKSRLLSRRVRSYFSKRPPAPPGSTFHEAKNYAQIRATSKIFYHATRTEAEAMILEDYLIEAFRPPLNRTNKPVRKNFLRITREDFPMLEHTKEVRADGSTFVGPIRGFNRFQPVLKSIQRAFGIRACAIPSDDLGRGPVELPMGCGNPKVARANCLAPCHCRGEGEREALKAMYLERVAALMEFLASGERCVLDDLVSTRDALSEKREFERAAEVQEHIENLEYLLNSPRMVLVGPEKLREVHELGDRIVCVVNDGIGG
ncbi:MAG: GIY-YIG nuclease family protein [Promethearchaeota archaeon]